MPYATATITNQSINGSINQSINGSIDQSINRWFNRTINQWFNQSIEQKHQLLLWPGKSQTRVVRLATRRFSIIFQTWSFLPAIIKYLILRDSEENGKKFGSYFLKNYKENILLAEKFVENGWFFRCFLSTWSKQIETIESRFLQKKITGILQRQRKVPQRGFSPWESPVKKDDFFGLFFGFFLGFFGLVK